MLLSLLVSQTSSKARVTQSFILLSLYALLVGLLVKIDWLVFKGAPKHKIPSVVLYHGQPRQPPALPEYLLDAK